MKHYFKKSVLLQLEPGFTIIGEITHFKVYSSVSSSVHLYLFTDYTPENPDLIIPLQNIGNGWWGISIQESLIGWLYAYKPVIKKQFERQQKITHYPIADPYSKSIIKKNNYLQIPLTKIELPKTFDWQGTDYIPIHDTRDLIIYETHVADQSGHKTAQSQYPLSYKGFTDPYSRGGLNHIKLMGINAVELLPIQASAPFEPSYLESTLDDNVNTWNYYGFNYWGYMTSFFFTPEPIWASNADTRPDSILDVSESAIIEVKELIRECHQSGIAVIMDVVYNHVSQYDINPLKYLDSPTYLKWNDDCTLSSDSGCGNDLNSKSPITRKLILDSLIYWVKEFKIDGFRFDLAPILDWETVASISTELKKINPYCVLIAEPWHLNSYKPTEFADRGWISWNDKFRNHIKGITPISQPGFILGNVSNNQSKYCVTNYLSGTLNYRENGLFPNSQCTMNYLESHDGYTLADFISLHFDSTAVDTPWRLKSPISGKELQIHKIAASLLLLSQGNVMIHAGQEFGKRKIIADTFIGDPKTGCPDHDSYNKFNETNFLNFDLINTNQELYDFYKYLISLRQSHPSLRKNDSSHIYLWDNQQQDHLTLTIDSSFPDDPYTFIFSLNLSNNDSVGLHIPDEDVWNIVIDSKNNNLTHLKINSYQVLLDPLSIVLLRKLRQ